MYRGYYTSMFLTKTYKKFLTNNHMETLEEILASNVYGGDFQLAFYAMLNKFVDEYEDMSQMKAMQQASELLDTLNNL